MPSKFEKHKNMNFHISFFMVLFSLSYFNGNIYDFLLQVYQLSINGFSNNSLYKRFALQTISKMLHVKIYCKKANDQWKYLDPTVNKSNQSKTNENACQKADDFEKYFKYLNEITFYLQEFRSVNRSVLSSNQIHTNKNVRILLEKKMWLSKFKDNARICMKFSQFNDVNELKSYQQPHFCMDARKIIDFFYSSEALNLNLFKKIFCVFVDIVPVHLMMNCEFANSKKSSQQSVTNHQNANGANARQPERELEIRSEDEFLYEKYLKEMEFSPEYNTIGKQFAKFETYGKEKTIQYLNHLWGKSIFNDKLINEKYASFQSHRTWIVFISW